MQKTKCVLAVFEGVWEKHAGPSYKKTNKKTEKKKLTIDDGKKSNKPTVYCTVQHTAPHSTVPRDAQIPKDDDIN